MDKYHANAYHKNAWMKTFKNESLSNQDGYRRSKWHSVDYANIGGLGNEPRSWESLFPTFEPCLPTQGTVNLTPSQRRAADRR